MAAPGPSPASSRSVDEILAACNGTATIGGLIEKIGELEQAKIMRRIEAELKLLSDAVVRHQQAAQAQPDGGRHRDQLLEITSEELRAGIAESLHEVGARACQEVETLTLGALRQLPPQYRALPVQNIFRLGPPGDAAALLQGAGGQAAAEAPEVAWPLAQQPHLQQVLARMEVARAEEDRLDRLSQEIRMTTARLGELPPEQRRSQICRLQTMSQSLCKSGQAHNGGA